ncbi:MAG TPA: lipopolysaccharide assembly protein LapA domain-containing protein [Candidatus Methanoperedens sp.]|nr:lipopolysaccharide assembly protein LapA domain-containing protein [Candidatus Methanoperedens sp.]
MLILLLIIGTGLVYVSKFNFAPVSLNLGTYIISNIPLFYVIIGSFIIGLILSYLVHLVRAVSTSFTLHGKNKQIKEDEDEIMELTRRVHQLELENEKLKHLSGNEPEDPNAL